MLELPDAGLWVCMEGRRDQQEGHQPPVHSLGSVGQGKRELLPCPAVSTAQLPEALGAQGVKCSRAPLEALSNSLFYHSSECGRTSATPPWWEQSGLRGLPCSSQWL